MSLIDDRGRLFGTVNLIDALVGILILGLIPLAYGAFLLFRVPAPIITAVTPGQVVAHTRGTVQVTGVDLRPFLTATLGSVSATGFLVQSPTLAEIKLPDLPPGTYDLTLADQGQVLAVKPAALTVITVPARATLRVRFVADPEVLAVMKAGDLDLGGPNVVADSDKAVLKEIGAERKSITVRTRTDLVLHRSLAFDEPMVSFLATIQVPLVSTQAGWSYNDRPVKVGAAFNFETTAGGMVGSVIDLQLDPETARLAR